MEIVTFFSFKGGVGRTQAVLNTACVFARRGKKVVMMDFDLHAPGLSLMKCLKARDGEDAVAQPGVLDFFEWLVLFDEALRRGESRPDPIDLAACAYSPVLVDRLGEGSGFLKIVAASGLGESDSDAASYSDRVHAIDSALMEVIQRTHHKGERNPVIEQIRSQFSRLPEDERPDAIFIDARTGITGIGDLLLTRSSDRIVLVTGLNDQNLWGLQSTLQDIERSVETPDWLRRITVVVSPVPQGDLELTGQRLEAIAGIMNRYVDPQEREMFGEIGLLPEPVAIPYDAQLALLEDPILLRHPDSNPSVSYRQLADRLGGKVEPLRFKGADRGDELATPKDEAPQEHPLARVLPWDAGLTPEIAEIVIRGFESVSKADKPYVGWVRHALNYLANSLEFAALTDEVKAPQVQQLAAMPVGERESLLLHFRKERHQLLSAPRDSWNFLAAKLANARVSWLYELPMARRGPVWTSVVLRLALEKTNWLGLVSKNASGFVWSEYWTSVAEELRLRGLREQALKIVEEGEEVLGGHPSFAVKSMQVLTRAGYWEGAVCLADGFLSRGSPLEFTVITLVLKSQALGLLGRCDAALGATRQAVEASRERGYKYGLAISLVQWGELLYGVGHHGEAMERYDEALELFRESKVQRGEALTLQSQGQLLLGCGQFAEGGAYLKEALPIFRKTGDRLNEANTLNLLGDMLMHAGQFGEARARFDEALLVCQEIWYRLGEGNTLRSLGRLLDIGGQRIEARSLYDEALGLFREIKSRIGEANTLWSIGELLLRGGETVEARRCYDEALGIYREIQNRLGEANTLQGLAKWHLAQEEFAECEALIDDCLERYAELSVPVGRLEILLLSARLSVARGEVADGLEMGRQVISEAREGGHLLLAREAEVWLSENTLAGSKD